MSLDAYIAFVAASIVLILIPGPNVALIVATSLARGRRAGLATVAGASAAMVLQLALVALGLAAAVAAVADWFEALRWLGVAYLFYLGVKAWRTPLVEARLVAEPHESTRFAFARGFFVSLSNPKTLLFFGAFLPQFVNPGAEPTRQLLELSATFVLFAILLDSGWALLANHTRPLFATRSRLHNRITGGFLIGAGLGLALARKG
jgi:threonine/homoserine/homoserine lactone efflux protein